jgi:hypothetical protein
VRHPLDRLPRQVHARPDCSAANDLLGIGALPEADLEHVLIAPVKLIKRVKNVLLLRINSKRPHLLFLGVRGLFFKCDPVTIEETPQHGNREALAAIFDQALLDLEQRDVRRAADQAQQVVALRLDAAGPAIAPGPFKHRAGGHFRAVVADDRCRLASLGDQSIEFTGHAPAADRGVDDKRQGRVEGPISRGVIALVEIDR